MNLPTIIMQGTEYMCPYCNKQFKLERYAIEHVNTCKTHSKLELAKSIIGIQAFEYYKNWIKTKKLHVHNDKDVFINSRYFNQFIEFTEFVNRVELVEPELFIQWAIIHRFQPYEWITNDVYGRYLIYLQKEISPIKAVNISIKYIDKCCRLNNIDISEFFNKIKPTEIIDLICKRKLSPWVCLNSEKFKKVVPTFDSSSKAYLSTIIDYEYWSNAKKQHKEVNDKIKMIVDELHL